MHTHLPVKIFKFITIIKYVFSGIPSRDGDLAHSGDEFRFRNHSHFKYSLLTYLELAVSDNNDDTSNSTLLPCCLSVVAVITASFCSSADCSAAGRTVHDHK